MAEPDDPRDVETPIEICGIRIRLDATLAAPGELWLERPDGDAIRIWPPTKPEDPHE